jgi:hypothetical protein
VRSKVTALTASWSAWTSGRCPDGPWWSGSPTGRARHRGARLPARRPGPAAPDGPRWRRVGAAGAPTTTSTCCGTPYPPPSRGRGRPAQVVGIATDFTACTMVPTAGRHPAVRAARWPASRTPTSSSGSTTPRRRRPTASTSSPASAARSWLARYGGLISSEWEFAKGLQLLEEAPSVRRDGALRRGRRLDRLAAERRATPQRLHGRLQGHLPGRHLPEPRRSSRAQPRLRRLRRPTSSSPRSAARAAGPAR